MLLILLLILILLLLLLPKDQDQEQEQEQEVGPKFNHTPRAGHSLGKEGDCAKFRAELPAMRLSIPAPLLLLVTCVRLCAETEPASSALGALKLLPRGEAKRLARIEARDGTPVPERWYFIVHDPKSETGVHEYVVAGGVIVASREVSQFAESLRPEDVVGGDALKINSDRAAKLAQQYALVNNMNVTAMQYELKKEGAAAAPLWSVTCLGEDGKELGRLVVSAGKGTVVSHDGFAAEPPPPAPPPPPIPATPSPVDRLRQPATAVIEPKATPAPVPVAIAVPVEPAATPPPKKPGLFDRLFGRKERTPPPE